MAPQDAVLYSILASAKANQVDPFAYVPRFSRPVLSEHSPHAAAALFPELG